MKIYLQSPSTYPFKINDTGGQWNCSDETAIKFQLQQHKFWRWVSVNVQNPTESSEAVIDIIESECLRIPFKTKQQMFRHSQQLCHGCNIINNKSFNIMLMLAIASI